MMTVLLYGHLAKRYGKRHTLAVKTSAEAIKAFCVNYRDFKKNIIQDGHAAYRVLVGKENHSDAESLHLPASENDVIKIVPVITGAGSFGKIIIGAALIYASIQFPGTAGALSGFLSSAASSVGWSLVLGGVSQMLFSPAKSQGTTEKPDNLPSYAFNGAINTVGQGNPVSVCYGGPIRIGSQVISAGLRAENL